MDYGMSFPLLYNSHKSILDVVQMPKRTKKLLGATSVKIKL